MMSSEVTYHPWSVREDVYTWCLQNILDLADILRQFSRACDMDHDLTPLEWTNILMKGVLLRIML